jgi:hypothetical protein
LTWNCCPSRARRAARSSKCFREKEGMKKEREKEGRQLLYLAMGKKHEVLGVPMTDIRG